MFRIAITGTLTLLPIVLLMRYFYSRDVNPEPRDVLMWTFVRGVLMAVLLIGSSWIIGPFWVTNWGAWKDALVSAFVVAAIPEELCKWWVIARYSARQRSFDEPMDGLVYGAAAALGFAALENVLYVSSGGWSVALLRALTAVPMHAMTGAMLGYGVSRRRFSGNTDHALIWPSIAILTHGGYNFCLFAANFGMQDGVISPSIAGGLIIGAAAILILAGLWTRKTVHRLHEYQLKVQDPPSDESPSR